MTLRTALVITGDADGAVQALNQVDQALAGAEKEAQDLSAAYDRADDATRKLAAAQTLASGKLDESKAALAAGAIGLEQYNRELLETKGALSLVAAEHTAAMGALRKSDAAFKSAIGGLDQLGTASGAANDNLGKVAKGGQLARHHMQNLGFQLNDLAIGFGAAATAGDKMGMMMAMVLMQQGSQIAGIMSQAEIGVFGLVRALGTMAAGFAPVLVPLGLLALGVAALTDEVNDNSQVHVTWMDTLLGVYDGVRAYLVDNLAPAYEWIANAIGTAWNYVLDATKTVFNQVVTIGVAAPNYIGAAFETMPAAIAEIFVDMANGVISAIEDLVNKAVGGLNSFVNRVESIIGKDLVGAIGSVDFGRVEQRFSGAGQRFGAAMSEATAKTFSNHFGTVGEYFSPFILDRAGMGKAAEDTGKKLGEKVGRAAGKATADEWAKTLEDIVRGGAISLVAILGTRDDLIAGIMKKSDAELESILAQIGSVEKAQGEWNDELERTLGLLGQIGSKGDALSSVLMAIQGLKTGDYSGVGGSAGVLLNALGNIQWTGEKDGERYIYKLGEEVLGALDEVFGGGGKFEQTMNTLFKGAATGAAFGGLLGGGKGGALGATAGGALGQVAGEKLLGKALGDFAGPIGSIVGAIAGNLIGKLVSGAKTGGAILSSSGVSGTWGTSSSRESSARSMGGSAMDALNQLADSLGVKLGTVTGSIGVRDNNLIYNPTGSASTKASKGAISFGQDEAALMKALVSDQISKGAFEGLSEGFKAYLTSGDVEQRLQDVLNLKSVQSEAAERRDPQAFALAELDKWRSSMLAIATATGEGMADIEFVFGERRKDILAQFTEDAGDIERQRREAEIELLAALGREDEAVAAARAMQLEALPAVVRAIKEQTFAALDAAAAENALAAARGAIAAEARSNFEAEQRMQAEIARALGDEARAVKIERQLELFAMTESLRPLALRKYAIQDEAAALALAAAAADELARKSQAISDEIAGLNRQWLQATGQTAKLRELDLSGLLSDEARALQQQIWAYEDQQKAAEEATRAIEAQAQALGSASSQFRKFAQDLRAFRDGIVANDNDLAAATGSARAQFLSVAASAQRGESAGFEGLPGAGKAFLDASMASAGSYLDYQRSVALVANAADVAIGVAEGQASLAEQQLGVLQQSAASLASGVEATVDVGKLIKELERVQTTEILPEVQDTLHEGFDKLAAELALLRGLVEVLRQNMNANAGAIAPAVRDIDDKLSGWDRGDHMAVTNDADTPLTTVAA